MFFFFFLRPSLQNKDSLIKQEVKRRSGWLTDPIKTTWINHMDWRRCAMQLMKSEKKLGREREFFLVRLGNLCTIENVTKTKQLTFPPLPPVTRTQTDLICRGSCINLLSSWAPTSVYLKTETKRRWGHMLRGCSSVSKQCELLFVAWPCAADAVLSCWLAVAQCTSME